MIENKEPGGGKDPEEEVATINIGNIGGGAAMDQFDLALSKVLENIVDLSTVATAARSVTLQVVFKPHSDRIKVETEVHVSAKLATTETHKSQIFVAKSESGGIVALDADPRQMPLWKVDKPAETPVISFRQNAK
jgi:hypothetical protein